MKKNIAWLVFVLTLIVGCKTTPVHITYEGSPIARDSFAAGIRAIERDPKGEDLVLGFTDSLVVIWDTRTRKPLREILKHRHIINDVAFSPDGNLLAIASGDEVFTVNDLRTGKVVDSVAPLNGPVTSLDFSSDGRYLVVGFAEKVVLICDVAKHEFRGKLSDPTGVITAVKFRPGTYDFYLADRDSSFYVANIKDTVSFKTKEQYGKIDVIATSSDGQLFATGGTNKLVKVWRAEPLSSLGYYQSDLGFITALAFTPDNKLLAAADQEGQVVFLSYSATPPDTTEKGVAAALKVFEVGRFKAHDKPIRGLAFSKDGSKLYTGGDDRTLKVWDAAKIIAELRAKTPKESP